MEGLHKAIELIQNTATRAEKAVVHHLGDERKVHVQQGNTLTPIDIPPPLRKHQVHTLADLLAYAEGTPKPIVWHNGESVVLILDDNDRRDQVTFPLTYSERFRCLQQLAELKPSFDQTKFIRLLRISLGLDNVAIVSKFRKLNWENGDKGTATSKHGDNRLSREVIARVQGVEDLPDEIRVLVPVYQQAGERQEHEVLCAVEIDEVNRQFQLLPLPDEMARVVDLHQADIRSRIDAELNSPVYFGEP